MKSKVENKLKVLLLCPTRMELRSFLDYDTLEQKNGVNQVSYKGSELGVELTGIGGVSTVFHTLLALEKFRPDVVLLAGVAGAYPEHELSVGDSVLVSQEREIDLGVYDEKGFQTIFERNLADPNGFPYQDGALNCAYVERVAGFPHVRSNTVNTIPGSNANPWGAAVENMEGAAFFYTCLQTGVPFLELRTISNLVSIERDSWQLETATCRLAAGIEQLLDTLFEVGR